MRQLVRPVAQRSPYVYASVSVEPITLPVEPDLRPLDAGTRSFRDSLAAISFTSPVDLADLEASMLRAMGQPTISAVVQAVRQAIKDVYHESLMCIDRSKWVSCSGRCDDIVRALITAELNSTAYMLRALSESVLSVEKGNSIQFAATEPLTGLWEIDCRVLRIVRLGDPAVPSRLMMGFGPSASGKTYWAKSLLTLFSSADPAFPKTLLTIDGGTYRDVSLVYKAVVEEAPKVCVLGFDNLVLSGLSYRTSLFASDSVKRRVLQFLTKQDIPISLYVPETLGDCGWLRKKSCPSKYANYIEITGDERWIGLLIWQHVTGAVCDQEGAMRCVGCTESGRKREVIEGKKYSNKAYSHSMREGDKELRMAPGGQYKIHNGGGAGRISLFQDFTVYNKATQPIKTALTEAQSKYSFVYREA